MGMKIDRGCFTQTIIVTEIDKACFMMTILLLISVVDFLDWNRQSIFDDVDYRVRVTEIDSLMNIIGLSCMPSGIRAMYFCRRSARHGHRKNMRNSSFSSSWTYAHKDVKTIAIARIVFRMHQERNTIRRRSSVLRSAKRVACHRASHRAWRAVLIAEAPTLSISVQISVRITPNWYREARSIKIAEPVLWRFLLWLLKSSRFQFQNKQWAFGNWSRLDFKIIMISVWPIDTVKQGSLNKPCANSDDFHNNFSLQKIDSVKHGVVDYHYENQHHETRP